MAECEYPPCEQPATQSRCLVTDPAPIWIKICAHHAAVLDRNRADEEFDFWRWADAAMQAPGRG